MNIDFQAVKKFIKKNAKQITIKMGAISAPIRCFVLSYAVGVFVVSATYFLLAVGMIYFGMAKLPDLLALLKELLSLQAVGAVAFVAKVFIDKDGDGLPDHLQSDEKIRRD